MDLGSPILLVIFFRATTIGIDPLIDYDYLLSESTRLMIDVCFEVSKRSG